MADRIEVRIRWMVLRDIPSVLTIEQGTEKEEKWDTKEKLQVHAKDLFYKVAVTSEEKVVGFVVCELHERRKCAHKKRACIVNFGVDPSLVNRGIEDQLIDHFPENRKQVVYVAGNKKIPNYVLPIFKRKGVSAITVEKTPSKQKSPQETKPSMIHNFTREEGKEKVRVTVFALGMPQDLERVLQRLEFRKTKTPEFPT